MRDIAGDTMGVFHTRRLCRGGDSTTVRSSKKQALRFNGSISARATCNAPNPARKQV